MSAHVDNARPNFTPSAIQFQKLSRRRSDDFRAGVPKAIEYAQVLGVSRLNCLVGKRIAGHSDDEHWRTLVENVRFAIREGGRTVGAGQVTEILD